MQHSKQLSRQNMRSFFGTALLKCNENLYFLKLKETTYWMHFKTPEYDLKSFFEMIIFV